MKFEVVERDLVYLYFNAHRDVDKETIDLIVSGQEFVFEVLCWDDIGFIGKEIIIKRDANSALLEVLKYNLIRRVD